MLKKKFAKDKCVTCKRCVVECAIRHSVSGNILSASLETPRPRSRIRVTTKKGKPHVLVCQNCTKPKCIEACKDDAITRHADGEITIDPKKCTGCLECVPACPFNSIQVNTDLNIAFICDDCEGFDTMACVEACQVGALVYAEKPKTSAAAVN
ncbi:MAG: 4Fe-4S binding protein [Deltaproteobacteria bacterium]|nr:4Fe-4S binding protein [Deltaproteobacteria bacterium]